MGTGYANDPKLTASKFVPNPFPRDGSDETRLYRTGDLVRYLPDGQIDFVGRIDHQVKIRGFRIEMGEIEALLEQHDHIRQAVVNRYTQDGDMRLAAYLIAQNEATVDLAFCEHFSSAHCPATWFPALLFISKHCP